MRTTENGIKIYRFDELKTPIHFELYENLCGKEVTFMTVDDLNMLKKYYAGVEFYEDGTVYEEV